MVSDSRGILATADDSGDSDLYLAPNKTNVHNFSFLPHAEDVGKMLEVGNIWRLKQNALWFVNLFKCIFFV